MGNAGRSEAGTKVGYRPHVVPCTRSWFASRSKNPWVGLGILQQAGFTGLYSSRTRTHHRAASFQRETLRQSTSPSWKISTQKHHFQGPSRQENAKLAQHWSAGFDRADEGAMCSVGLSSHPADRWSDKSFWLLLPGEMKWTQWRLHVLQSQLSREKRDLGLNRIVC